jgi:hypothetical protein
VAQNLIGGHNFDPFQMDNAIAAVCEGTTRRGVYGTM